MKKFAVTLLCILMILTLCVPAFAEDQRYKPITEITEHELTQFALSFAKVYDSSLELTAGNFVPVYDADDTLIGFSVSYYMDGDPYGYVLLDFRDEDPVSEFSFGEGVDGPYEQLSGPAAQIDAAETGEKKLVKLSVLDYAVPSYEDGPGVYITRTGDNLTAAELKSAGECETQSTQSSVDHGDVVYDSWSWLMIDGGGVYGSGTNVYLKKYSRDKSVITAKDVEDNTGTYACAVVALTGIANQENILIGSVYNTYSQLWVYTNTYVREIKNGITYGSTDVDDFMTGFKSYCKAVGKTCNAERVTDPDFEYFKQRIDDKTHDYSICLHFRANQEKEYEDGYREERVAGHAVNVVGYLIANYNGYYSQYLAIADGWWSTLPRYISLTNIQMVSTIGDFFEIK